MVNLTNKIYVDGIRTLEDLYFLIDPNLEPVLEKVLYHFNELKNESERESVDSPIKLNNFQNIANSFDKYLRKKIYDFFLFNNNVFQISYCDKGDELNFSKWDQVISLVGDILGTFELFEFYRDLNFSIDGDGIRVSSFINESFNFNKVRLKIKEKIKAFAKNEVLLTFKLNESVYDGILSFDIFFDFSFNNHLLYKVDFEDKSNEVLLFSNILPNYIVDYKFLENLRKTVFLEVTEDLRLKRFNYLPSYIKNDFAEKEFFHFHFLFHSVSLIIPKKGKVLPIRNLSSDFFDGKSYFEERNFSKEKKGKKPVIDLFSLIS
ncbi:MAG: hypothetical protein CME68_08840 [Halobacteriovoraceae bacterium]|nr:hypothetical protein [Halobacteriovoraceae bacterium]